MALFPIIEVQPISQIGDLVRIDASRVVLNGDTPAVVGVFITPDISEDEVEVTNADQNEWFLDWVYTSAGTKEIMLRIVAGTGVDEITVTKTAEVEVKTAAAESLFSTDADMKVIEPEILKWLPLGSSNWNHVHRLSQKNILEWLDEIRLFKADGSQWAPEDLVTKSQVRKLSLYMTLAIIFNSLSNQPDDIYAVKAAYYAQKQVAAQDRNYLDLDLDGDGEVSESEKTDLRSFTLVRR